MGKEIENRLRDMKTEKNMFKLDLEDEWESCRRRKGRGMIYRSSLRDSLWEEFKPKGRL